VSKRRRERGESDDDLLGSLSQNELTSPDEPSLTSFANSAYGSRVGNELFPEMNKGRVKVQSLPIDQIFPDFAQPRRALPSTVRKYWNGNVDFESMSYLFEMWLKEVQIERKGKPLDVFSYLLGDVTERAPAQLEENIGQVSSSLGTLEGALLRVAILAASIRRDGLTNPITVVQRGNVFVIETGERRWLAYHLLHLYFGDEADWLKIPARVMDALSIWRQASENNVRSDLNAIAKARQLALVIMAVYQEQGAKFRPFEIFKNEQAFYAQVADPIQYKIPYGKGELVLNAMGFENKSTVKRYRDLLALPPEVWTRADDYNVPESVLRQMVNRPMEQQMGQFNMWLNTGRLHPEDKQNPWVGDTTRKQFGKFSRLLDYEIQQWQGEYDDLDEPSKELVINFLTDLLDRLKN
jgi:hypothetical protein